MTGDAVTPGLEPQLPEPVAPSDAYADLAAALEALPTGRHRRLATQMVESLVELFRIKPALVDMKITGAAIAEMGEAYEMFQPYEDAPKVTIFGSARTQDHDPLWRAAHDVAEELAANGWMVITGAGPGIMQAAMEGAGREQSIGVSIRLPFEQGANPIIAGDEKYVSMKYFFTRKLMLIKESRGFICLPGGFGTLDETFELLTLTQTGKGLPVPIVFLDVPGDNYWDAVHDFVEGLLVERGLVSPADTKLYLVTDDCHRAVDEVLRFYSNYHSLRYVGDLLVIRMQHTVTDDQLALLNERFGHLCSRGTIARVDALEPERREHDHPTLPRIAFTFAKHGYGELRALIDTLNSFAP
jgi:uncharacterized protein (TIGR00730 family)